MFAISSVTPQLMFPVPHLLGALHSLQNAADKGALVMQTNQQCRKHSSTHKAQCEQSQANVALVKLKDELNLSHLPESWAQELLPQLFNRTQPDTRWSSSYVSTETFFENKHGFKASELQTLHTAHLGTRLFQSAVLQHQLLHSNLYSRYTPFYEQRRGFKTRRAATAHQLTSTSKALKQQGTIKSFAESFFARRVVDQLRSDLGIKKELDPEPVQAQRKSKPAEESGIILPDIHSAFENHKKTRLEHMSQERQQDIDYSSFKTGYYDGYVMGRQGDSQNDGSSKKTGTIKLLSYAYSAVLLFCVGYVIVKLAPLYKLSIGIGSSDVDVLGSSDVTFDDVRGIAEAKAELEEIVSYLKNPEKYTKLGGKLPKGVLLVGAPGTGKTLLARAVAGEAGVPFFFASGSDFDHMFVGSGAKKVRDLFDKAKLKAPCVIFIDELDSIGSKRVESPNHPYARQTINQLLAEMDGFEKNEGIILLGATNFPKSLDNALTRPGRFDVSVTVPTPDVNGRVEILDLYLGKVTVSQDVDKEVLARGMVGFTGADINNLVNQAALRAAKLNKEAVDMRDLDFAKDKILMGPERKSIVIDDKNKEITAFHEGGHALVAYLTKDSKPINKATIMPRGDSLGHVSLLPKKDQWNMTKSQLLAQMDICMGGRVAEEIIFGSDHVTTGAGSDFDQATRIARLMVTKFGMSEQLGVMTYSEPDEYNLTVGVPSQETQSVIETEVRTLLEESYKRASNLLKTHSKEHKRLADALLKYETLTSEDIDLVIKGKKLQPRI